MDRSAADFRALRARICAIGPATRAAVEALHLKVDLMGKEYVAEGLLEAFAGHELAGKRVLLPRAAIARDLVPVELTRRGAHVDVVEAYRTVMPESPGALPLTAAGILDCRLHHLHQLFHGSELCGAGRRGVSGRSAGGVHRSHYHAHGAGPGHRGHGASHGIYHRRIAGSRAPNMRDWNDSPVRPMRPHIIGIAGPSSSGKTELARQLCLKLPGTSIVSLDSYYRAISHLPLEERRQDQFDHPDALDWELLHEHL